MTTPEVEVISFDRLPEFAKRGSLQPGHVIGDIGDGRNLRYFEEFLVSHLENWHALPIRLSPRNDWLAKGRLDQVLRPKGFNGNFRNIYAAIVEAEQPGKQIGAIITCDLVVRATETIGRLCSRVEYSGGSSTQSFASSRYVQKPPTLKQLEAINASVSQESIAQAIALEALHRSQPLRGGTPE